MNTSADSATQSAADERAALQVALITVSDRGAAKKRIDESGPAACEVLEAAGHKVALSTIVPDSRKKIRQAVKAALDAGVAAILLTGGTGIGPRDKTPEAVIPLLNLHLPGVGEELRRRGLAAGAPGALLSRAFGGVIREPDDRSVLVIAAPGSIDGARDGAELLASVAPHAAHQLSGGDHKRASEAK